MSVNSFITLCTLVSSLVVSTAFGQCPPVSEGSLPQLEKIAHVIVPTKKVFNQATHVPSNFLVPVDLTKKQRVTADAAVLSSATVPILLKRPNFLVGKDVGFTGPISIQVPGAGLGSTIVEQDGQFIIVGASDTFNGQVNEQGLFLARFAADGTPDQSFGQGGSTRIILFAQNHMANNSSPIVALSPNGEIVVARTITDMFPGNEPGDRIAVARFDHNGSIDATFGNGGFVYTTIENHFQAYSVAVQRDERIIVGGQSGHIGNCLKKPCMRLATLVRYQTNGQLDLTFGNGGVVQANFLLSSHPGTLVGTSSYSNLFIQDNGLIDAAGDVQTGTGTGEIVAPADMLIAEYLPTGELNPVFAGEGAAMLTFDGPYQKFGASSFAVRDNGRILAGGTASLYQKIDGETVLVDQAFIFAQLRPSGELDATFGSAGKVVININPLGGPSPSRPLDYLTKVMLDSTGDIYAAGIASGPVGNSESAIDIIALHSNGSLKKTFGKAGIFSLGTYFPWHIWLAQDALLTLNGRLVISGIHWPNEHDPDAFILWAYSIKPGPAGCSLPTIHISAHTGHQAVNSGQKKAPTKRSAVNTWKKKVHAAVKEVNTWEKKVLQHAKK
jgi:uncharacterized delta-60 repeat protein